MKNYPFESFICNLKIGQKLLVFPAIFSLAFVALIAYVLVYVIDAQVRATGSKISS